MQHNALIKYLECSILILEIGNRWAFKVNKS